MMAKRRCEFCDEPLPKDARANQKFCDADCRRGRLRSEPDEAEVEGDEILVGEVEAGLDEALKEAGDAIGPLDAGTVAAARVLARKIDEEQARWEYCLEWAELWVAWLREVEADPDYDEPPPKSPPKPPPADNVSISVFLKYADALGLTPAARAAVPGKPKGEEGGGGSKLEGLQGGVRKPKSA